MKKLSLGMAAVLALLSIAGCAQNYGQGQSPAAGRYERLSRWSQILAVLRSCAAGAVTASYAIEFAQGAVIAC
jgi:hypothetical protein